MAATESGMDQGSTFAWTQAYGDKRGAREIFRDAAFALAVTALVAGVAGFVGYEKPAAAEVTRIASFQY